jgi:D-inositol-3-phosphate glycosyltransferase
MDVMSDRAARARIAVISLHTSPLDQPGTGDSGGMNVEIRELSERLAGRDVAVDVYTRCAGRGVPEVDVLGPLVRVVQIPAGPCAPVDRDSLPDVVPSFVDSVLDRAEAHGPYDLVHAHYWLSVPAGAKAKARWGVPLGASFHTLGEVKNLASESGRPEPLVRVAGERDAVAAADLILAPTEEEARNLIALYGADRRRIRVVPPGVDPGWFAPRPREASRRALGIEGPLALFVGRLQPLKGPDVAIRAVAEARRAAPDVAGRLTLAVVGGPSGPDGLNYVDGLHRLVRDLGVAASVRFFGPMRHEDLPQIYSGADFLVAPSRSESFGLAALEAQSCGVPVVAAAVGGLRSVIRHQRSGFLLGNHDPAAYAEAMIRILRDPATAARLSGEARRRALSFTWERTVGGVMDAYGELLPEVLDVARAS